MPTMRLMDKRPGLDSALRAIFRHAAVQRCTPTPWPASRRTSTPCSPTSLPGGRVGEPADHESHRAVEQGVQAAHQGDGDRGGRAECLRAVRLRRPEDGTCVEESPLQEPRLTSLQTGPRLFHARRLALPRLPSSRTSLVTADSKQVVPSTERPSSKH